jgi:sec-independent protein translocase protein TatA
MQARQWMVGQFGRLFHRMAHFATSPTMHYTCVYKVRRFPMGQGCGTASSELQILVLFSSLRSLRSLRQKMGGNMFLKNIGPLELIILLVIVAMVFGVGRIADLGGALGRSISEFRKEVGKSDKEKEAQETKEEADEETKPAA